MIFVDSNCPTFPDSSLPCRKMLIPTDVTRIVGGNPSEFQFKFVINGTGNSKLTITGKVEVICSKAVQIISPS